METEVASFSQQLATILDQGMLQSERLMRPPSLYQIGILILCILVAWGLNKWLNPKFRGWIRTLHGRPKWQLRWLAIFAQRTFLIIFTILIWISAWIISEVTPFISRRFLLELVGTITLAILILGFATRFVKNASLRTLVTWGLWIYVTLYYLGLIDELTQFLDSLALDIGDFHLSVLTILTALIVIGTLFAAARMLNGMVSRQIHTNKDISPSMKVLTRKFVQVLLFGAAFFIGLKVVGVDLTGLAVLSGAIGLGLGFGLQKVVSNLVSGIIILLDKSIKPGDVISVGGTFGWINALGARYVSITTRDGREYLIPNEDLITGQVVNWSHSNDFVRLDITFGVAYDDDPHKVRALAIEAASGVDRVLAFRPPVCHITGFGDSSVDYVLRFWITDPSVGLTNIRGNVYLALWDTFKANRISIPFPQREVRMLSDNDIATPEMS